MKEASFNEFILDQLKALGRVECRSMFGGRGLYRNGTFFGILFKSRLYFKTDLSSRPFYLEKGMKPFRPNARQMLKSYYEVPADLLEDPDELVIWAERAIACQVEKRQANREKA